MIVDKDGKVLANVTKPIELFENQAAYEDWKEDTFKYEGKTEEGFTENDFITVVKNHLTAGAEVYWKTPANSSDTPDKWLASNFTDIKEGDLIFYKNPGNSTFGVFVISGIKSNNLLKGITYSYTINSIADKGLKLFTDVKIDKFTEEFYLPTNINFDGRVQNSKKVNNLIKSITLTELDETSSKNLYFVLPKQTTIN